ncbi:MAG: LPS-assembly protein LptD [Pedosphaera sp.]|nr:LPS-assembly protein LptD [Pedosphaera sp.]
MNLSRLFLICAAVLFALPAVSRAQEGQQILIENLTDMSEVVYDYSKGIGWGTNGIIIRYTNAVLTARQVTVNINTGDADAAGEVNLQREGVTWRGERIRYNFKTRQMEAADFRTGRTPIFAAGKNLTADRTNQVYVVKSARVTTDDVENPSYEVRAKSIKIIEGKRIEARNATVYAGGVPVMFFPVFSKSLSHHPNFWVLTPGYRSLYGPYLLGSYNWFWSTNLHGALDLDYRQKRGVGGGPEFGWDLGRWGTGDSSFYFTHDENPGLDPNGAPIRDDRHRINFTHQATLATNLTAKLVVREHSDAQMVRDFFESDYRKDPEPKSFLELNRAWPNWSLDLLVQPQLNDFFQTVERLPDIKLSGIRQQLGITPLFYESETSAGYFRFRPDDSVVTNSYAALRADTFHQLLLPMTWFGWLNFTPRVGMRLTHYGESEGQGTTLDERDRSVFNTGAELSFKLSRTWADARNKTLDVSGIRHIIEPSFNYVFVPNPSRAPRELPQFDSELPSVRLLPLNYPDYNAIDSVDSQNVVRLGLRNKVQTKRGDDVQNLVNWALYTDWRLDRRLGQTRFSDFYSDLDLRPRSWMTLNSELRYGVESGHLRSANHTLTLTPNDVWSLSVGHLYFREDPAFGPISANNLIRTGIHYRLNENWGFRTTHFYEARDGKLEEQYYTIYRDFRSWTSALTLRARNYRVGQDDITIAITFSLKAFPRFRLGQDRDLHSVLLGG